MPKGRPRNPRECRHCGDVFVPPNGNAFFCSLRCRFWSKVAPADERGCRLWQASVFAAGYGQFVVGSDDERTTLLAHRVAWELGNGLIPAGMCVLHHCDVKLCCTIEHMFLGTLADNMADKVAKGRQARGEGYGFARLTEADVREIRQVGRAERQVDLASRFGVQQTTISRVLRRDTWAHVE